MVRQQHPLTICDYQKMVRAYHDESDRAAAVLAGSFVEHFTEKYLRSLMRGNANIDSLFSYGPLGTFTSRIRLAYAFGFIDDQLRNDLHFIKEIRNHFAHTPSRATFQDDVAKALCAHLSTHNIKTEPRLQFLYAATLSVARMHNAILERKRRTSKIEPNKASETSS